MIDGTYDVSVNVLFKTLTAKVTLTSEGQNVTALVEGMGVAKTAQGTCDGDFFWFDGELPSPMGTLAFELSGFVNKDKLSADCKTKLGTFKAKGTRI